MTCEQCGDPMYRNGRGEIEHNCREDWEKCSSCEELYDPKEILEQYRDKKMCLTCLDGEPL